MHHSENADPQKSRQGLASWAVDYVLKILYDIKKMNSLETALPLTGDGVLRFSLLWILVHGWWKGRFWLCLGYHFGQITHINGVLRLDDYSLPQATPKSFSKKTKALSEKLEHRPVLWELARDSRVVMDAREFRPNRLAWLVHVQPLIRAFNQFSIAPKEEPLLLNRCVAQVDNYRPVVVTKSALVTDSISTVTFHCRPLFYEVTMYQKIPLLAIV